MKLEEEIKNPWPVEETVKRILGETKYSSFSSSSKELGKFPTLHEKYQTKGSKQENFGNYLNSHIQNEQEKALSQEKSLNSNRLFNTSNKNQYNSQPADYNNIGRRLMKTQDATNIKLENIDKNFMALHNMSKYPSIISKNQVDEYLDKSAPYYKDKEITFWSTNLNKGNVYRSFQKGQNSFSRSSGFTQPIQNSKSVNQFCGNVSNTASNNVVILNNEDVEFIEKYDHTILKKNQADDLTVKIQNKLFLKFSESWINLRKLRKYLKNLNRKSSKSEFIDSSYFKYFFVNFGIYLNDSEIKFIFEKFDKNRNNHINYNEFLDSMTNFDLQRQTLIGDFYSQVKNNYNENISFKKLVSLIQPDLHPEVKFLNLSFT